MFSKYFTTIMVTCSLLAPSSAWSAEKCACVSSQGTPMRILSTNGDVTYPGKRGFEPAKAGTVISGGGQLTVSDASNAEISFGASCKVSVTENSFVRTSPTKNNQLCLKVVNVDGFDIKPATFAIDVNGDGDDDNELLLLLLAIAGVGGAIAATSGGGDNPVSN